MNLKINILEGEKNLKVSRFLRKSREHVLAIFKELSLNISKSRLTKVRKHKNDERVSQESWNKRSKTVSNHFNGSYLKMGLHKINKSLSTDLSLLNKNNKLADEDDVFDLEYCTYCYQGRLNVTATWVQCDSCDGWVHESCLNPDHNLTFSGIFICKLCEGDSNNQIFESDSLPGELVVFLNSIEMNVIQRNQLEQDTILQRNSLIWREERKKFITSSNFGRIFKTKSAKSRISLAKYLQVDKDLSNIPSVKYGIENETRAIKIYENMMNCKVQKSGLRVHKDISFLATSPDGLVGDDGIVEVKCPIQAKTVSLDKVYLNYLNHDGHLKLSHYYYFQVQGLLEVTNRPWCDFVIFSPLGLKVERIFRQPNFFSKVIFPMLKEFYLFYYLPNFIRPSLTSEFKWRTLKDIKLLPNGLVDDIEYYRTIPCSRDLTIANFNNYNLIIKELRISDFISLSNENWLTGSSVSLLMHILNEDSRTQIVDEIIATKIFSDTMYSDYFLKNIYLDKPKIVMPHIVNGNHFCLAMVDLQNQTFSNIDPYRSSYEKSKTKLLILQNFLNRYNHYHNTNIQFQNLKIKIEKHFLQKDSFNCGPLIIYFFEQLHKGRDAEVQCNLVEYRKYLKTKILNNATCVNTVCMFCSRNCLSTDSVVKCQSCLRKMHSKCIKLGDHCCIKNGICELCYLY